MLCVTGVGGQLGQTIFRESEISTYTLTLSELQS